MMLKGPGSAELGRMSFDPPGKGGYDLSGLVFERLKFAGGQM